jgi:hypothetical protein
MCNKSGQMNWPYFMNICTPFQSFYPANYSSPFLRAIRPKFVSFVFYVIRNSKFVIFSSALQQKIIRLSLFLFFPQTVFL